MWYFQYGIPAIAGPRPLRVNKLNLEIYFRPNSIYRVRVGQQTHFRQVSGKKKYVGTLLILNGLSIYLK